jgi:spore maturation protein CgeB
MEIAFFGSSLVSAYWNGAATYYRGMIRALAARGHRVTFYEPDAYDRQKHRDMADPPWARVVVYPPDEAGATAALEAARGAHVLVKASGVGVLDEFLEQQVARHAPTGTLTIFWDVDAPATLARLAANPDDPFAPLVPAFDLILTYGGGAPVVDAYAARGARLCVPVYNALDPESHHPTLPDPRFRAHLGFLGNRLPDREARVEEFFLRAAALRPADRFVLGGAGWEDKPLPPNVRRVGHVYTRDHNAFNCTPLALLNISRDSMASNGWSPATRVFEAAGAGACLISDAWRGMEAFLTPGEEVLVARDGSEVAALLATLDADTAARIGDRARRRVLREHTYDHRAAQVEAILEGTGRRQPVPNASAR